MFPKINPNGCIMVMQLCSGNFSLAANTLLDDVDALSLVLTCTGERLLNGTIVYLEVDPDHLIETAVRYYKQPSLHLTHPLSIQYSGAAAIDAGGPRRQFFTNVLKALKSHYSLFEGSDNQLVPVYSASVLASGLLKVLGQVIVHSCLQEGPGFPFLAPFVYKSICRMSMDEILPYYVEVSDLPISMRYLVEQVCLYSKLRCF